MRLESGGDKNQAAWKSFSGVIYVHDPYRKPTQVDWCECTKVNGWNLVKELGKKAGVSSQYALPRSLCSWQSFISFILET